MRLVFFLIGFSYLVAGISQEPLRAPKVEKLVFDGKLDEHFWQNLTPLEFIQFQPNYAHATSEKLSVYVVYDDLYLYLTGRLYVSDPSHIRQQTFKRDADNPSTDYFGFVIDSYNDKENGLAFFTAPTGLRWDAEVNNDASTENSIGQDWNAHWDVLTYLSSEYYDVEIRVPWSTLKFEANKNGNVMGIGIWRYLAAKNEMNLFPDISPDLGEMANWRPSLFQEFLFENIRSKKPVYITPYILAGNQRQNTLNDEETQFEYDQQLNYNAGLDVKYNLTSNLTLDVTMNTDFAQVESDDEQINLSRYELFRPEKRQFFQERSSLFDFKFNHVNHLFYSRNIGIEDEEAVPILGGLRLTGKIKEMDVGVINMQTSSAGNSFFEGFKKDNLSNNYSVLRVKQTAFNPYSYIGGMITNKTDFKGDFNTAYGLDGVFRLWGNDYLTFKWAQTFEDSIKNKPFSLDPARVYLGMERRTFKGFNYDISLGSTGKEYNPEMGFVSRNNYIFTQAWLRYGVIFKEESWWQNMGLYSGGWGDYNYEIDLVDQGQFSVGINMQAKNAWEFRSSFKYSHDYLTEEISFTDDVVVPVGSYYYYEFDLNASTPYNARFGITSEVEFGKYFDGDYYSLELEPRWNPNAHFEMYGAYEFKFIDFSERNQKLISHIVRMRAIYMLNAQFSVSAFIQYNNDSNLFLSNIKLRYNPKEGNDLYIVFNEVLNGDRDRMTPGYPLLNTEVFALKYTYTFKM